MTEGVAIGRSFNTGTTQTGRPTTDLSPDFVFESGGHVTSFGYEVVVRIPVPQHQVPGRRSAGLGHQRRPESPALRPRADVGPHAARRGLVPRPIGHARRSHRSRPGHGVRPQPLLTSRAVGDSADPSPWRYGVSRPAFGANVRWGITSNLTLTGTVSPRFRRSRVGRHQARDRSAQRGLVSRETAVLPRRPRTVQHAEHARSTHARSNRRSKPRSSRARSAVCRLPIFPRSTKSSRPSPERAPALQRPPAATRHRERVDHRLDDHRQGTGRRVQSPRERGQPLHLRQGLLRSVAGRREHDARQHRAHHRRPALVRPLHACRSHVRT